jgi:heterodisulfide reductase subunit C
MALVNPDFAQKLAKHGNDTALECFNCGTCAAICPLIHEHFPRRMIRYVQLGAEDRILENARGTLALSALWTLHPDMPDGARIPEK